MQANGQAGRWAEVAPLLSYGVDVLLSDADVAWIRNPLPYFAAARRAHPAADLLMLTDRAFNNYATAPAAAGPATEAAAAQARASLAGDLDLEDAYDSSISYNIGVIYMYAGAPSEDWRRRQPECEREPGVALRGVGGRGARRRAQGRGRALGV